MKKARNVLPNETNMKEIQKITSGDGEEFLFYIQN
jgi:hypothetical protein